MTAAAGKAVTPSTSGYSGTPLSRKLGLKAGCRLLARNAPEHYQTLLSPVPEGAVFGSRLTQQTDIVHLFSTRRGSLGKELASLRRRIRPDAMVWVSWPKKSSGVATDITEDVIRELCLPLGFVDVKVCAVDATWSGLKLVIRKSLR